MPKKVFKTTKNSNIKKSKLQMLERYTMDIERCKYGVKNIYIYYNITKLQCNNNNAIVEIIFTTFTIYTISVIAKHEGM